MGRTGVYHVVNHTVGENWKLLRPFAWLTVALRLFPILLVGWLVALILGLLPAVMAGLIVAAVLTNRYARRHAVPL